MTNNEWPPLSQNVSRGDYSHCNIPQVTTSQSSTITPIASLQGSSLPLSQNVSQDGYSHRNIPQGTTTQPSATSPTAILLGSSLLSGIDEQRLSRSVKVSKTVAFTIEEAQRKLSSIQTDLIVLQLTTNDLKVKVPEAVHNLVFQK